jgi:hypothetical protein
MTDQRLLLSIDLAMRHFAFAVRKSGFDDFEIIAIRFRSMDMILSMMPVE